MRNYDYVPDMPNYEHPDWCGEDREPEEEEECQHATKLNGQCVKCGEYIDQVTAMFLVFCVIQAVAFSYAVLIT